MNVIAGILIGIANEFWLARILAPFIWGVVWYGRVILFKRDVYERYIEYYKDRRQKFGMPPWLSFFFIEYATALVTSLVFSVISGVVYDLIKK